MATTATAATAAHSRTRDTRTEYPHIVWREGVVGGWPRVEGTRLAVALIADLWHRDETLANLLDRDPDRTPAAVYSALAYYHDHQAAIDTQIAANRPETVLAELRRDPHWEERAPGQFRPKPPFGAGSRAAD